MSIEEIRHEEQLVDYKIKEIINNLGYKRFRGEEIDEEYERDCEIRIQKLKQDFNIWGSEVRKKGMFRRRKALCCLSLKRLVHSLSGVFKGISDDTCDVLTCENNHVNVESDLVESLINHCSNFYGIVEADPDDDTSSDDDDFEDVEYVSFEEVNDVEQEEKEFDLEDILQFKDVNPSVRVVK
ncbi:hypothetical protein Tco_0564014 [Tanacetum coccineum]